MSHWLSPEQAAAWSTQQIYRVARLGLRPDPLIHVALTERAGGDERIGHVDVWAYPRALLEAIVDVREDRRLH